MFLTLLLLHAAILWQLDSAQNGAPLDVRSRHSYPDPMRQFRECSRQSASYVCDPDRVIVTAEADQLNTLLANMVNETRCPCSRYSCSLHPEGYKIGIALMKQIRPDVEFRVRSDDERDEKVQYTEWKMNEGKLFAHELLRKWHMGRCDEDIVIFFSLHDGILYTAVGDVAQMKLNHTIIKAISMNARGDFGPGGNIFKGLLKLTKEYRSVLFGTYHASGRPTASEVRSAGHSLEFAASSIGRFASFLLTSLVVIVLGCLLS